MTLNRTLLALLALAGLGCTSFDSGPASGPRTSYANTVAAADLDGNGHTDLIAGSGLYQDGGAFPGYASVVRQTGAGTYATAARYGLGADPVAVAVGDLNGDGKLDLAVANASSGTVTVLLQNPAAPGTFTPAATLSTGTGAPLDLAIGDLNQDGHNDLAVAVSGSGVLVFFQSGVAPGTFSAPQTFTVVGDPRALALGDFSGNGRMDMAVATNADNVNLLVQGATGGTFTAGPVLATGPDPVALKAYDLGGTGRLDLVTANWKAATTTAGVTVLRQTAPGTFAAGVSYDVGDYYAAGLAIGDVDGDSHPDLVVACAGLPGDPGSVAILPSVTATPGTFGSPVNYGGAYGPLGVALGDFNGDGRLDLVVADGLPYVRFQQADGSFGNRTSIGY